MAKIYICDRCGAKLENKRYTQKQLDKLSDSHFLYMGTTRDACMGKYFDLCEDCKDSLYEWFTKVN